MPKITLNQLMYGTSKLQQAKDGTLV